MSGVRRDAWMAVLALGILALWFHTLAIRPLFNPDEGRYAEIPREMLQRGDWTVPHLNGLAYIEKPPLQYWATALIYRVLGVSEFSARLYTALSALGALAAVWWASRRIWTRELAARATAMAASMLLFLLLGQWLTLDMSLTFYLTVCLAAFLVAQVHAEQGESDASRRCMVLAWGAAALGVMSKGLVAAVIPAAVLVLYTLLTRQFAPWRRLNILQGLPVFALIAVPWHALAARRLPDFVDFFFIREHFARFLTPVSEREEASWFFGAIFLLGTLPWTFGSVRGLLTGWRTTAPSGRFDPGVFLWVWIVFILVFFSLSDSKLIPYILPVMPAVAILIAAAPLAALTRDLSRSAVLMATAGAGGLIGAVLLPRLLTSGERAPYFLQLRGTFAALAAVLMIAGAIVYSRRRRDVTVNTAMLSAGWILAMLLLLRGVDAVAPIYSGVTLTRGVPAPPEDAPVYSVRTYDQTLPFYWRRTVTLVDFRGELDYGLRHDSAAGIGSLEEFRVRWDHENRAFAVMEPSVFDALRAGGAPMRVLARDLHRVLVTRP